MTFFDYFYLFLSVPGAGVPEFPLKVIIEIHLGKCPSRDPTMKSLEEAIMLEFNPPQHDIATQIGTRTVPICPRVKVAISVATAAEEVICVGVKIAK